MKTCLVVLAAGMGSRFGGLKQLQPLTPDGRVLLDFSIDDAISVGFDKIVFVIRREMQDLFKMTLGARTEQKTEVEYVFQDLVVESRTKPLGTGHALLCCKEVVDCPFAILNADDYYGKTALKKIYDYLKNDCIVDKSCMIAYKLGNTTSKNGVVSRGVCKVQNGYLQTITESYGIAPDCTLDGRQLPYDTPVSMNLWGFTPSLFPLLQLKFDLFLKKSNVLQDEFILTKVINDLIGENQLSVKVFDTDEQWVGMTYRQDLPMVREFVLKLCK